MVMDHGPGGLQNILRGREARHHMVCHGTVMILVEPQIFTVEVHLTHGGAGGLAAAERLR